MEGSRCVTDQDQRIGVDTRSDLYNNAVVFVDHRAGVAADYCTTQHLLATVLQTQAHAAVFILFVSS